MIKDIPLQVWICGFPYEIQPIENPLDVDRDKDRPLVGQVDCDMQKIRLGTKRQGWKFPPEFMWSTLLHEVIHVIANKYEIKELEGENSESAVERLANGLTDFLLRNGFLEEDE